MSVFQAAMDHTISDTLELIEKVSTKGGLKKLRFFMHT
ncbi:MAG: hypothetical protein Ct9H300mP28_36650 [Pseudomonadota bacterium]|nr:MAG: hypothetical protein Ct9H300mP28_36650 [Pseudomonadota bacterium]